MSDQALWEYKSLTLETKGFLSRGVVDVDQLDLALNELGAQGWELVSSMPIGEGSVGTARLAFTFKRQLLKP